MELSKSDQEKVNKIIESQKNSGISDNQVYNIIIQTLKVFNNVPQYDGSGNTKYNN